MTKPDTDFADEDFALARRALRLLQGHAPGREQPLPDMDLTRLMTFNGSDGRALPLARFGVTRFLDALSASPPLIASSVRGDSSNPRAAEAGQRLAAMYEASRLEKKAMEHSREALLWLDKAVEACRMAAAKRDDIWAGIPAKFRTSERQSILDALLAAKDRTREALVLMDAWVRQLPSGGVVNSFPSTSGLPLAQRNDSLGDQALSLSEEGISCEAIGYVMGWDYGSPKQSKDRITKRLEQARARRTARAL